MGKKGVALKALLSILTSIFLFGCLVNEPGYVPNTKEGIIASEKITVFTPTPISREKRTK